MVPMRMMSVMGSCFMSGARFEVGQGEALPYLAYTGQVCAAEQKDLNIIQGVEFYY